MKKKKDKSTETIFALVATVLGVFLIFSLFENDDSKIVSKKGRKYLSDDKKMKELNSKISVSEAKNAHQEVFV